MDVHAKLPYGVTRVPITTARGIREQNTPGRRLAPREPQPTKGQSHVRAEYRPVPARRAGRIPRIDKTWTTPS